MACKHEDAHFHINMACFGDTNLRYLEITGHCKECNAPLKFRCDAAGVSPDRPMVNISREMMHPPCLFGDEVYDGRAIGMSVTRVS